LSELDLLCRQYYYIQRLTPEYYRKGVINVTPTLYILLIVASIAFTCRFWTLNIFNTKFRENTASYYIYCAIYFLMTAAGTLLVQGWDGINTHTIILAIVYGLIYTFNMFFYMKAVLIGPIGYSALINSLALIIPIIYAAIFYQEPFKITQLVGLGLLMVSFYFGSISPKGQESKPMTLKWWIYILASFFIGGMLGILFREQQHLFPGRYIGGFLAISFSLAAVVSIVCGLMMRKRAGQKIRGFKNKWVLLCAVGTAASTLLGNVINMGVSSQVPSIILFPIVNGGMVVMTTILSYTYFKEKATRRGIVGMVIGIIALCFLGI